LDRKRLLIGIRQKHRESVVVVVVNPTATVVNRHCPHSLVGLTKVSNNNIVDRVNLPHKLPTTYLGAKVDREWRQLIAGHSKSLEIEEVFEHSVVGSRCREVVEAGRAASSHLEK
jgi:hypothetical protein